MHDKNNVPIIILMRDKWKVNVYPIVSQAFMQTANGIIDMDLFLMWTHVKFLKIVWRSDKTFSWPCYNIEDEKSKALFVTQRKKTSHCADE